MVHLVCLVAKQVLFIIVLYGITGKITRLSFSVMKTPINVIMS